MDSLVIITNGIFHILEGTPICKFLSFPDWLRKENDIKKNQQTTNNV